MPKRGETRRCSRKTNVVKSRHQPPRTACGVDRESSATSTSMPNTGRFLQEIVASVQMPCALVNTVDTADVIDLTEDSPINTALRRKRNHSVHSREEHIFNDTVTVLDDDIDEIPQEIKKSAIVVELDDTLDSPKKKSNLADKPNISCPICLDNTMTSDMKPMTTPCGHVFCLKCLTTIAESTKKVSYVPKTIMS